MITKNDQYNPFSPIILIEWANQSHYELLLPINLDDNEIPIGFHYNLEDEMFLNINNITRNSSIIKQIK